MRFFAVALFFFGAAASYAQAPEVPHKMHFADMTLTIRDDARREIQKDVDALAQPSKYYVMKVERAKTYFPIIEKIFAEENVPDDLKFLVLQESALVPDAVSSSNAVGFWQFKDFTAIQMGMRVDREIDERMNLISATRGAARYLKQNNLQFDNWLYALQSYQMGAGGVKRSVGDKDNGARHMEITSETYWYVKKFLAHKVAFENALQGEPQTKVSVFESHNKKTLADLAKDISLDESLLKEYNKWARNGSIPDDKVYHIIIPGAKLDQDFSKLMLTTSAKQDKTEPAKSLAQITAKAEPEKKEINNVEAIKANVGETSSALAARAGISLNDLLRYNDISIDDRIVAGSFYFIEKKKSRGSVAYYKVMPGDNLWSISQQYGIQLRKLNKMNRLEGTETLPIGTMVWLNAKKPSGDFILPVVEEDAVAKLDDSSFNWEVKEKAIVTPVVNEVSPVKEVIKKDSIEKVIPDVSNDSVTIHTIKKGETLYSIAGIYSVEILDIVKDNNLSLADGLKQGQVIKIKKSTLKNVAPSIEKEEVVAKVDEQLIIYEVKASDTLYGVARQHGVTIKEIMDWNSKDTFSLSLGEKLKIWKR